MNNFSVIENEEGIPVYTEDDITTCIERYFTQLFKSERGERVQIVETALSPKISDEETCTS